MYRDGELRRLFGWRFLGKLLSLLGERTVFIYLWLGYALYIIAAISKSSQTVSDFFYLGSVSGFENIPVFFLLGFIHAVSFFTTRHIYHKLGPPPIVENWTTNEISSHLEEQRAFALREFNGKIEALEKSHADITARTLGSESISPTITKEVSREIFSAGLILREYTNLQRNIEAATMVSLDKQDAPFLFLAYFFAAISLAAWIGHLLKLIGWAYGEI